MLSMNGFLTTILHWTNLCICNANANTWSSAASIYTLPWKTSPWMRNTGFQRWHDSIPHRLKAFATQLFLVTICPDSDRTLSGLQQFTLQVRDKRFESSHSILLQVCTYYQPFNGSVVECGMWLISVTGGSCLMPSSCLQEGLSSTLITMSRNQLALCGYE